MRDSGLESRQWWIAIAVALIVAAAMAALMWAARVPIPETFQAAHLRPRQVEVAAITSGDRTLQEAAIMHDQRPLFLPTERNVSLRPLGLPEAGSRLLNRDEQKLAFSRELTLHIPVPVVAPRNALDAIMEARGTPAPLHGFGRAETPVTPLVARGPVVEVVASATNRRALIAALPADARPATDQPWRPVEFTAAIGPAGLIGSLVVTERSDAEEVERFFQNYLAKFFRLGERLPPGFYRVTVGP